MWITCGILATRLRIAASNPSRRWLLRKSPPLDRMHVSRLTRKMRLTSQVGIRSSERLKRSLHDSVFSFFQMLKSCSSVPFDSTEYLDLSNKSIGTKKSSLAIVRQHDCLAVCLDSKLALCPKLSHLFLGDNALESIDGVEQSAALWKIDCSRNKVSDAWGRTTRGEEERRRRGAVFAYRICYVVMNPAHLHVATGKSRGKSFAARCRAIFRDVVSCSERTSTPNLFMRPCLVV